MAVFVAFIIVILNGLTLTDNCHATHICDSLPTESMDGTFTNYADYKLDYKPGKDMLDLHLWYSGTSPYGHLTSKKTSPLQSPWLSPKLYSTVQTTPCNKVTSPLRSLLPSPVGDLNSEVPLYSIRAFHLYTNISLQMIVSAFTINTGYAQCLMECVS